MRNASNRASVPEVEAALISPRRTRRHARIRAELARAAQEHRIASIHKIARRLNRSDTAISHGIGRLLRRQKPLKDK